jgi:hypothetical protein
MMNWKRIWKEAVKVKLRYYPGICLEEPRKTTIWTAYGQTEIRTEYHLNASLERYCCPNFLSHVEETL